MQEIPRGSDLDGGGTQITWEKHSLTLNSACGERKTVSVFDVYGNHPRRELSICSNGDEMVIAFTAEESESILNFLKGFI